MSERFAGIDWWCDMGIIELAGVLELADAAPNDRLFPRLFQWILRNTSPQPPQIIIFEKLCVLLKVWVFPFGRCGQRYGDG